MLDKFIAIKLSFARDSVVIQTEYLLPLRFIPYLLWTVVYSFEEVFGVICLALWLLSTKLCHLRTGLTNFSTFILWQMVFSWERDELLMKRAFISLLLVLLLLLLAQLV